MDRREFLKGIGVGTATTLLTPQASASLILPEDKVVEIITDATDVDLSGNVLNLTDSIISMQISVDNSLIVSVREDGKTIEKFNFDPDVGLGRRVMELELEVYVDRKSVTAALNMDSVTLNMGKFGHAFIHIREANLVATGPNDFVVMNISGVVIPSKSNIIPPHGVGGTLNA
jgi:hypothetical protein